MATIRDLDPEKHSTERAQHIFLYPCCQKWPCTYFIFPVVWQKQQKMDCSDAAMPEVIILMLCEEVLNSLQRPLFY